jgi:hypothetical protein
MSWIDKRNIWETATKTWNELVELLHWNSSAKLSDWGTYSFTARKLIVFIFCVRDVALFNHQSCTDTVWRDIALWSITHIVQPDLARYWVVRRAMCRRALSYVWIISSPTFSAYGKNLATILCCWQCLDVRFDIDNFSSPCHERPSVISVVFRDPSRFKAFTMSSSYSVCEVEAYQLTNQDFTCNVSIAHDHGPNVGCIV